ncbi:hypothetical protein EAJ10_22935 [Bacteroides thetaiotaomicron]|uniref:Bro-N domain-containing protein n=1 Tax=Bacteroides thetaiotaomicron TaxID=818 RepID=A0A7J5JBV2_BACT4|nr:Bro-N domain-containing protein [Bacteroides thetaiotaomicron]KAB4448165.1 Bro-N domain-containing protein [Bacteroides thetaiotaomicron]RYT15126.1 hypothetical protein EAJ10_22935 [Bacteroides thetaiotaomicron]
MNKIILFEHPQFGQVRTVEINGKIWFCASDIASALGYSNPRDAVVRHCKPMGVVLCACCTTQSSYQLSQNLCLFP